MLKSFCEYQINALNILQYTFSF